MASPSKLSAPGPVAGRAEHWSAIASHAKGREYLSVIIQRIATGQVPPSVIDALRVSEIVALPKSKGGVPPILLSLVLKRYALKGVVKALKGDTSKAVGPGQFGVGVPGGAEAALLSVRMAVSGMPNA
eukprot:11978800-Alexandrium_andersonii.AAC.1